MSKFKKGKAYICDQSETKYECIADPTDRWNGWHQPLFTKEVFDKIISDADINITGLTKEGCFMTDYDPEGIAGTRVLDNKVYYEFYGWVWDFDANRSMI